MPDLTRAQKERVGQNLAQGYRQYGKVSPRKPYRDDDEGGDGDTSLSLFEGHPLLMGPVGAASDLSHIIQDRQDVNELADERSDELTPELKKELQKALAKTYEKQHQHTAAPSPKPY